MKTIYDELPEEHENGLTGSELMERYGFRDRRELQKRIRFERMNHFPILVKGNKYYRSDDPKEFDRCVRTMKSMGLRTLQMAWALERDRPENDGQLTFDEYLDGFKDTLAAGEDKRCIGKS